MQYHANSARCADESAHHPVARFGVERAPIHQSYGVIRKLVGAAGGVGLLLVPDSNAPMSGALPLNRSITPCPLDHVSDRSSVSVFVV